MPARHTRLALFIAGAATLGALTSGCNTESSDTPAAPASGAPHSATSPAPAPSTAASSMPSVEGVSADAAQKLCSQLHGQLSDWRVQGPTLGKPALNILVQTWAAQNGMVNLKVIQDRSIVDKVTSGSCPQDRDEALKALNLPSLASGLVGW